MENISTEKAFFCNLELKKAKRKFPKNCLCEILFGEAFLDGKTWCKSKFLFFGGGKIAFRFFLE
jgi:hypothetical protein